MLWRDLSRVAFSASGRSLGGVSLCGPGDVAHFCKSSFIGNSLTRSGTPMAVCARGQGWAIATETIWFTKPKIPPASPFTEEVVLKGSKLRHCERCLSKPGRVMDHELSPPSANDLLGGEPASLCPVSLFPTSRPHPPRLAAPSQFGCWVSKGEFFL